VGSDRNDPALTIERRGKGLWVTFTRPEAMNSLTTAIVDGLEVAIGRAERDADIHAIVLTGSGRAFSAGADLNAVPPVSDGPEGAEAFGAFLTRASEVFTAFERSSVPTIAAINGYALAGGLEIALACDVIVAAASAKFGDGHAKYGQFPGGGATVRLPRRVGRAYAKYLMFSGAVISAGEAERRGLAELVVADDELVAEVEKLVDLIAAGSRLGLRIMKEQLAAPYDDDESALRSELEAAVAYARSLDRAEGLTAFREKRMPAFLGR
jgi:enoyl-CoA hydratase/carnithine racemase